MKSSLLAASLMLAAPLPASAIGFSATSEFCFKLTKYTDVFRISSFAVGDNLFDFGTDVASAPSGYALPLMGLSVPVITSGFLHKAVLISDNDIKSAFGGHNYCTVEWTEVLFFSASISCDGGHKGEWTKSNIGATAFPCTGPVPPDALGAKPIGFTPSDK